MKYLVKYCIGIDEVGRGPLAGPVTVCACAVAFGFDTTTHLAGIRDSKKLSPKKRDEWFEKLQALKIAGEINFVCTSISAGEIDSIGIAPAIKKALTQSLDSLVQSLDVHPTEVELFLDGSLYAPEKFANQQTIIKGDEKIPLISAASIVAKVTRDKYMDEQAKLYPGYGLEKHKGYGTAAHIQAIRKLGPSVIHRKSFLH